MRYGDNQLKKKVDKNLLWKQEKVYSPNELSENFNDIDDEDMPEEIDTTTISAVHKFGKTFVNVFPAEENDIKLNKSVLYRRFFN